MRRRSASTVITVVLLLFVVAGIWGVYDGNRQVNRIWPVDATPVPVAKGDPAVLARGNHLLRVWGCAECHGVEFGGRVQLTSNSFGRILAPNLTTGKGGAAALHSDAVLARAIRSGIGADGRSLKLMPSVATQRLGDEDVGAMLAALRAMSPVDRELPASELRFGALLMISFAKAPLLAAEAIDHTVPRPPMPAIGDTADYGGYLAGACTTCHGANFAGGEVPGAPEEVRAPNLTPVGALKDWTREQFAAAVRGGKKPDGKVMDPRVMPWLAYSEYDDTEIAALWNYVRGLPAVIDTP